ncbi:MAG: TerC/Alx family metal homeostasis membrane protein [Sciscionella sp.]
MVVPAWIWGLTVLALLFLLAVDLVIVDRKPHDVGIREAARWVAFYIACAGVFGAGLWLVAGSRWAGEFFAGYITEYSLSVDNLFVFVVIMGAFAVPKIHQHKVLLVGVLLALILRGILILAGAAVIANFIAIFYLFGAFLIVTAYRMLRSAWRSEDDGEYSENTALRLIRTVLPVTEDYHGAKSLVKVAGKRMVTPMLIVMIAIGTTDLLFALDSIPAIFGLTKHPYLVFTANAFALMGLRQLYFLLGGLLRKLIYLPIGLALILLFIGIKLIFEVLHHDWLPFVGGRQSVEVPVFGTWLSLGVIVGVLAVTVAASLIKSRALAREDAERQLAQEDEGRAA